MSNIVNGYIIGCDFMRFDEFKIDGVEIKINDEYALINGTIKIMLRNKRGYYKQAGLAWCWAA